MDRKGDSAAINEFCLVLNLMQMTVYFRSEAVGDSFMINLLLPLCLMIMKGITTIQKEQINSLRFFQHEVILEKVLQSIPRFELTRALILGNVDHTKVNIIFKTEDESLFQVNTTIWAVTDEYVCLKGGMNIPIKAIVEIEF